MSVDEKISKTLVNQVCNFYRISDKDLFSKTRKREIVIPRQVFFYLCKKHTKLSLSKIGLISLKYGRKKELDHASVLHGINKIKNTSSTEKSLLKSVELLDKLITPEKDYTQVDFEKELSIIDLKNHYEDIILKMKLETSVYYLIQDYLLQLD